MVNALHWGGLALIAALVWSVLEVLLALFCVAGLVRTAQRRTPEEAPRARGTGTHAA